MKFQEFVEKLYEIGWNSPCDAQWTKISEFWDELSQTEIEPHPRYYKKYVVSKSDGTPVDPEAEYFVLRLDTDINARKAAWEYASLISYTQPKFAEEIREKIDYLGGTK